jgi:hypothetical protein
MAGLALEQVGVLLADAGRRGLLPAGHSDAVHVFAVPLQVPLGGEF